MESFIRKLSTRHFFFVYFILFLYLILNQNFIDSIDFKIRKKHYGDGFTRK